MERLTNRNEENTAYYYPKCFDECEGYCYSDKCNRCDFSEKICEKLGEYEDMEEQGLLVKLPCKVGTKVWTIMTGMTGKHPIIVSSEFKLEFLELIGIAVFLNKEEAKEQLNKLKEMG